MDFNRFEKAAREGGLGPLEKIQRVTKRKRTNRVLNVFLVIFILVFLVSGGLLAHYYLTIRKNEKKAGETKKMILDETEIQQEISSLPPEDVMEEILPDGTVQKYIRVDDQMILAAFSDIYRKHRDFVGWLTVPGTNIDYPVMQTPGEEEYYLRRDIDGNSNTAGTLFLDTSGNMTVPTDNNIIYGHNMRAGTMFHELLKFSDEGFCREHRFFYFDTIYGEGTYEVIAAFKGEVLDADAEGFRYYNFFRAESEEAFDTYVTECKKLTPFTIEATASYGDQLVTLSTCSYHADEGRYVVVGKRIR